MSEIKSRSKQMSWFKSPGNAEVLVSKMLARS